jgi:hypothetical protein
MTNSKTTTSPKSSEEQTAFPPIDDETFKFSVKNLLEENFNCQRAKKYSHCLVINKEDEAAGYFIPAENVVLSGWVDKNPKTVEIRINKEKIQGIFFNEVNFVVLASTPVYFAYKKDEEKNGIKAGTIIGWAENLPRHWYKKNKEFADICQDRLIYLLDENNELLHTKPLIIRHRNVHLLSVGSILEDTFDLAERAWADYFGLDPSSQNDKWRCLVVHKIKFVGEMVGPNATKQHACCKVAEFRAPSKDTLKNGF